MSYRDRSRLSGYRSQPVSNRTSLYLSSDFKSSYTEDLTDFDRQFKKLLDRTESFTNRVEKLQNTSSYLTRGFRRIDSTVTGIRSQRDVIGSSYTFQPDDQESTEVEWKRLLDSGKLIERAVELVRQRYRYPKPMFAYSPESPSPYEYIVSENTVLIPNPKSPRDKEGQRIRDKGSEICAHKSYDDETKVEYRAPAQKRLRKLDLERTKSLTALTELTELDENTEAGEKNQRYPDIPYPSIHTTLAERKCSINKSEEKSTVNGTNYTRELNTIESSQVKPTTNGTYTRESNTTESSLVKTTTNSTYTRETNTTESLRIKPTTSNKRVTKQFSSERIFDDSIDNSETSAADDDDKIKERKPSFLRTLKNAANRSKRRPTTMYDELSSDTLPSESKESPINKNKLSPYENDYNRRGSDHLIYTNAELVRMAQEDLKNKKSAESKPAEKPAPKEEPRSPKKKYFSSSSFHEYTGGNRVPLRERLKNKTDESTTSEEEDRRYSIDSRSKLVERATQLANEKSSKEDTSLRSRFLRRFRLGSDETKESERRLRKKNEDSETASSTLKKDDERKKTTDDKTKNDSLRSNNRKSTDVEERSKSSDSPRDTHSRRFAKQSSTDLNESFRLDNRVSIRERNEMKNEDSKQEISKKGEDPSPKYTSRYLDKSNALNESEKKTENIYTKNESYSKYTESSSGKNETSSPKIDSSTINTSSVIRRKKKKNDENDETFDVETIIRKSIQVQEEEIKPVVKSENIDVEFRSPRISLLAAEVTEQTVIPGVTIDKVLDDAFFTVLLQREISEEDIADVLKIHVENPNVDDLFEKIRLIPIDSSVTASGCSETTSSNEHYTTCSEFSGNEAVTSDTASAVEKSTEWKPTSRWSVEIEGANERLYKGLLDLTKTVNGSADGLHQAMLEKFSVNSEREEIAFNRTEISSIVNTEEKIINNNGDVEAKHEHRDVSVTTDVDTCTSLPRKDAMKESKTDDKFEASPFKLIGKKPDNDPKNNIVNNVSMSPFSSADNISFDKAVDDTASDVVKMLSNCNTIDQISNEIQKPLTQTNDSSDRSSSLSNLGSSDIPGNNINEISQFGSTTKMKLSYIHKHEHNIKSFKGNLSVSADDISINNTTYSKDTAANTDNKSAVNKRELMHKSKSFNDASIKQRYDVDEPKHAKDLKNEKSLSTGKSKTYSTSITVSSEKNNNREDIPLQKDEKRDDMLIQNEETHEDGTAIGTVRDIENTNVIATENVDGPETDTFEEKKIVTSISPKLTSKVKGATLTVKKVKSVDGKSLEEIRSRVDALKSNSATSLGKPAFEGKSLDEIKNRIQEIKNRKRELRLPGSKSPAETDIVLSEEKYSCISPISGEFGDVDIETDRKAMDVMIEKSSRNIKLQNSELERNDVKNTLCDIVEIVEKRTIITNENRPVVSTVSVPSDSTQRGVNNNNSDLSRVQIKIENNKNEIDNDEDAVFETPSSSKLVNNTLGNTIINKQDNSMKTSDDTERHNSSFTIKMHVQRPDKDRTKTLSNKQSEDGEVIRINQGDGVHMITPLNIEDATAVINGISEPSSRNGNTDIKKDSAVDETKKSTTQISTKHTLPRQLSIVEYRRKKLESQTSDTSNHSNLSDDENKSERKSSIADFSDASEDLSPRRKCYSHSKKDLKSFEMDYSSSSDNEKNENHPEAMSNISIVDRLSNRYLKRISSIDQSTNLGKIEPSNTTLT